MITPQENELLTQVGPGTPGGELFRRYWHPVAMLPEISEETPTKFVRMLGEDLVLFRCAEGTGDRGQGTGDGQGHSLAPDPRSQAPVRVGLIGDHCSHRGASLLYGRVEERGIACAYHGWLYDVNGSCLETPAEPADSLLHLTVKHKAYPVREHYGMYWTYMGPSPAPLLPRYDVPELGPISVVKLTSQFDCNWLQIMENHVDQSHVVILHQETGAGGGRKAASSTRGLVDELVSIEYSETPFGIKRRQIHTNGLDDTDLCPFPCTQRIFNDISVKVPIDDTHTRQFSIYTDISFDSLPPGARGFGGLGPPDSNRRLGRGGKLSPQTPIQYCIDLTSDGKSRADAIHPQATYLMNVLRFQDVMALETQGPISDRPHERLGTADRGVALLREVLKREIQKVQQGLDPMGVVRDPEAPPIETFIQSYIDNVRRGLVHPHSHDARGTRPLALAGVR